MYTVVSSGKYVVTIVWSNQVLILCQVGELTTSPDFTITHSSIINTSTWKTDKAFGSAHVIVVHHYQIT